MPPIINVTKSNFYDRSSVINAYHEAVAEPIDFEKIEKELHEILNRLDRKTADCWAVRELEGAAKRHDWDFNRLYRTNFIRANCRALPPSLFL